MGIIEALKKSKEITRGQRVNLLGLLLTYFCLVILGAILLIFGVFFALSIILIGNAFVYEKLMHAHKTEESAVSPEPAVV